MNKISVIVPVYKAEPYLCRCIDSILRQSYRNLELILIDDGSPDRCGVICDVYAEADSRVVVIHQENAGVSAARNVGIDWVLKNSTSRWVTFVDSDDWIHREYLQVLLTTADQYNTKMAVCDMLWTDSMCDDLELQQGKIQILEGEQVFSECYEITLSVCCKLIDRMVLTNIRFPEGKRYEDAAVCHLMVFSAGKVAVCSEKLYYYFCNENSFTRTSWTERRMDVIYVHKFRLEYLQKHGYEKAYHRELEEYAARITSNLYSLTDIIDDNEEYREIFEDLRIKLKEAVREAEELDVFHLDRERLMTYAYICPGNIVWRIARMMQRIWRKIHER